MDQYKAQRNKWRREYFALSKENDCFIRMVYHVMTSLPHLYTLDLSAQGETLDQSTLNWLLSLTTVRHLKRVRLDMTDEIPRPLNFAEWPLETLDIELNWDFEYAYEREGLDASEHW